MTISNDRNIFFRHFRRDKIKIYFIDETRVTQSFHLQYFLQPFLSLKNQQSNKSITFSYRHILENENEKKKYLLKI